LLIFILNFYNVKHLIAQAPSHINFQAIATDDDGHHLLNTNLQIRLSLIDSAQGGVLVYQELRAVQTNNFGSFSFQIGLNPSFTPVGIFKNINWRTGNKYLKVDYDPTNSLNFNLSLGMIKIVSTPYAFSSDNLKYIDISGVQDGQTLIYNAASGVFYPGTLQTGSLSSGSGINITGNIISNTGDLSNTNELQILSKSNDTIFLSNGGFAVIPPQGQVTLLKPFVNIMSATAIQSTSAILNGKVNPNGMAAYTEFEWGLTTSYGNSLVVNQSPVTGQSLINVNATLSNLDNGTTYYFRIKAWNAVGDSVSEGGSFTTATSLPDVTTTSVYAIKGNTALSGGIVNNNGGLPLTARGLCWSTSPNPTISNNFTTDGTETGAYNSLITGLDTCTFYYVRAYATNAMGTAYGNEISFNSGYLVGSTYAGGYVIYNDGNGFGLISAPVTCGVTAPFGCEGTLIGTATNIYSGEANTENIVAVCPTNNAASVCRNFVYNGYDDWYLPSKDELNLIYSNLIAQNIGGYIIGNYVSSSEFDNNNVWYQNFVAGAQISFNKDWQWYNIIAVRSFATACAVIAAPEIITLSVSQITTTTARCSSKILNNGGGFISARGFCWSTSHNPTITGSFSLNGTGNNAFSGNITGLLPNTTYYVRAYATNTAGTVYGNELSFKTIATNETVITKPAIAVSGARATTGGHIFDDLGSPITSRGICYRTSHSPTLSNLIIYSGADTGSFTIIMRDLNPHTTYYVKAFAISANDTVYGNEITFTTTGQMIIGDHFQGGIVYYVDSAGTQGLVAALTDQALNLEWGCFGSYYGANSTSLFSGQSNTTLIVNGCSTPGIPARLCDELVSNGYSNWYMPSKDELYLMYTNLFLTGLCTFSSDYYGSSTELNGNAFYGYSLTTGSLGVLSKLTTPINVRAVNSFNTM
jgi:hypothetical protein